MALLMVHLLAARQWVRARGAELDVPDFYLGAISPDAIHVRDHDDKSHKNEIHLNNWMVPHPDDVIAYWREHHTPFDIGYGVHVLTDGQWVQRYKARFPQLILPTGRVDPKIYYHDTFITDFQLYDHREGDALFRLVERGNAPANHPLLTQYEISEWQKMMIAAYHEGCKETGEAKYLDEGYCLDFIDACQPLIEETYERALAQRRNEA